MFLDHGKSPQDILGAAKLKVDGNFHLHVHQGYISWSSGINEFHKCITAIRLHQRLWSDCGTNFDSVCKEMKMYPPSPDQTSVEKFLHDRRCTWVFNPPNSSHIGGTWEQMIGIAQRILDSVLLHVGCPQLKQEVLITLMAEVTGIVNAWLLVPVSSDPELLLLLTHICSWHKRLVHHLPHRLTLSK